MSSFFQTIELSNFKVKKMIDAGFVVVNNLYKKYPAQPTWILKNIAFSVQQKEICSIIGRSGAGKSTLLRCLNCLESIDDGSIHIDNVAVESLDDTSKRLLLQKIGTIFQTFNLLSRRTVLENILLPAQWMGQPLKKMRQKALFLAKKVGLLDKISMYPHHLSGGQRQRVAIARALMTDASLLLCDEFTSALDPETSLEILSLLRQLNQDLGVTIILVTHDMAVVREVSDRVIVMEKGEIVENGRVEEVLLRPAHPVTQSLVRGLFIRQLPNDILHQLSPTPVEGEVVIQLVFSGMCVRQPVIADLIRQFNILVNILAGSLDHLKESSLGVLTISMPNDPVKLDQALNHFKMHEISAEILGYLPHV